MKLNEIRGLAGDDLKARIAEARAELAKERASIASGTRSEKPGKIRKLRRAIAKMLTIINERAKGINAGIAAGKQEQKKEEKKAEAKPEPKKEEEKKEVKKAVEEKQARQETREKKEEQMFVYSESKSTDIIKPVKKKAEEKKQAGSVESDDRTEIIRPKK